MVKIATLRRRSWAGMGWLLVIGVGLLVALALGNTIVVLAALTAALLSTWLLLGGQAPPRASSQPASTDAGGPPRAQRDVWTTDGTLRQAQVVSVAAVDGYQTVLTIDGYALVNAKGRVVYALNRESQVPMSEPVVVTIFDTEAPAFAEEVAAR